MKVIETKFISYILVELIKIYIIDILENLEQNLHYYGY